MALINTLIPSAASDVVAILDSNFNQVFPTARPIKATVKPTSKPMEHPVETGTIITDDRIVLPIEIELSMILTAADYRSVYAQIFLLFQNAPLLIVQTRTSTYKNMYIRQMPHEEDADMFDAIPLALGLKEATIVAPQTGTLPAPSVATAPDQSTVNRGAQQTGASYPVAEVPSAQITEPGFTLPDNTQNSALPPANALVVRRAPDGSIPLLTTQQFKDMSDAATSNIGNALPP